MIRTGLLLGRTPLARRLVAAVLMFGTAIVVAILRSQPQWLWFELASNLFAALIGFLFLHFRWRDRERRAMTPKKVQDIFS